MAGRWVGDRAGELLDDLGADKVTLSDVGGASSYLVMGSCRAGNDPDTSVLDITCKVHGIENLYVVDGSFMPSSGVGPPTLTILANSFRVADHLLQHFQGASIE
nr:GMC oxidoreductase [Eilatimonas milleporae]